MINKGVKLKDIAQAKKLLRENGYFVTKISKDMMDDMRACDNCSDDINCNTCSNLVCIKLTHHKAHS